MASTTVFNYVGTIDQFNTDAADPTTDLFVKLAAGYHVQHTVILPLQNKDGTRSYLWVLSVGGV